MPKFRFEAHSVIGVEAASEALAHAVLLEQNRELRLITASGRVSKAGKILSNRIDCAIANLPKGTHYEIRSEPASINFVRKIK